MLSREITWSNNIMIMSRAKTNGQYDLQMIISNEKNQLFIAKNVELTPLHDSYTLEFLDIPTVHKEKELRKSIVTNLRDFILEFGKDFTFVGEEYHIQVGNKDFYIDSLFFNRKLACLVAIDLKK